MNTQEIYQNEREWKTSGASYDSYSNCYKSWVRQDESKAIGILVADVDEVMCEGMALSIAKSLNNTFGKGINPESVERMKNTLRLIEKYYSDEEWQREVETEAIAEGHGSFVEVIMDYIKEALNAATL